MRSILFLITFFFVFYDSINSQNIIPDSLIDLSGFYDSAHHWNDINEEKIIYPDSGQKRYRPSEIEKIADNILLYQKENGGWAKNYDMLAILTEEQRKILLQNKSQLNTTFDNGSTHRQLYFLSQVIAKTNDDKYKSAFINGLDFVLSAQYANGGWPQCFPDTSGYQKYITFNDGAMIGILKLLQHVSVNKKHYSFLSDEYRKKIEAAFENGLECVLNCQLLVNENLTAWSQQHDNVTLKPQEARTFEPVAISNMESAEIVLFLMSIENQSSKIIRAIKAAVDWFEKSRIIGIKVVEIKAAHADYKYHSTDIDKLVVEDKTAPSIWTRYYDINSLIPIFCNRDGRIVYSLGEVERERRTGYTWYTYAPQTVLDQYPQWKMKITSQ
jgi:PelA/Pel-15E family pectate lyase